MPFKTLDEGKFREKRVLVRADLNAPVEGGEAQDCLRFERYAKTIQELLEKGAKVVVMAHQGRPTRDDFTTLQKHAEILSKYLDRKVRYIDEIFSYNVRTIIRDMDPGEVILLENVRFLSEELRNLSPEEHSKSIFVQTLAPEFDKYVNDAFSAAHRPHASLVGFTPVLDSYAGREMESELKALRKVSKNIKKPEVLILGGAKPEDLVSVIESFSKREEISKILLGGIIGELALIARGHELGKKEDWLKEHGFLKYLDKTKEIITRYEEKIEIPEDLAYEVNGKRKEFSIGEVPGDYLCYDIGSRTIERYKEIMEGAAQVLMKGPVGAFEREGFGKGSRELIKKIAELDAFTALGGGHTSSIVKRSQFKVSDFSYVSIAGGALVRFLSGQKLPVVEALKRYG